MYKDKEYFKELIGRDLTDIEKQNLLEAAIDVGALVAEDNTDALVELEAEVDEQKNDLDNLRHDFEVLESKLLEKDQELEKYKDIYGELN